MQILALSAPVQDVPAGEREGLVAAYHRFLASVVMPQVSRSSRRLEDMHVRLHAGLSHAAVSHHSITASTMRRTMAGMEFGHARAWLTLSCDFDHIHMGCCGVSQTWPGRSAHPSEERDASSALTRR